jgi:hypothetical protein
MNVTLVFDEKNLIHTLASSHSYKIFFFYIYKDSRYFIDDVSLR